MENCLFFFVLLIRIAFKPVDVVFTPDHILADLLHRFQNFIPRRPSIIFSNGAPFENDFCKRFKYVHQKSKEHFHPEEAPNTLMFLIGNGFNTALYQKPSDFDQDKVRRNYNLPSDKTIILCLAALNTEHKRVDWIIDEIAKLDGRFHLVLCGQEGPDTPELKRHAEESDAECTFMKVPMTEIPQLLWASDIMVLGSLSEGFPRVIAEAMASETPILVHPHENARWILGEESRCFADMTKFGALAAKINQWTQGGEPTPQSVASNGEKIRREFTRATVSPQYLAMFEQVGQDRQRERSS